MVEEILMKTNPSRPGWFVTDELLYNTPGAANTSRWTVRPHVWRPPTDMFETEDVVTVRVEVAGMKESEFTILLQDRQLVIRGSRVDTSERRAYHQMEIRYGEFSTEVDLPTSVMVQQASAEYRNGFLLVTLPKVKPQKIQITDL